ncbi:TonB-dependent receptor [Polaribacter vadi]|uniref:SusC/RagA family TonB-linked outer membrane protein n=1 Tax=Polaribacter TaxID=52959 RepID=UPI001C09C744|nr:MULTISPECIES: TonB-dependent receptor [Polaribacter]MBU3011288.1 TonB-dependent receptor [Polaribacter vadi]MDO6741101.1 TonB-dependent receptor [Polaribacter sp. 1_MG-2023]
MKKLNLLLLLLSISWGSFSQEIIKGVVKDFGGIPLLGVSIIEKGTKNGTITDFDGVYQIEVAPNSTLVFSYLGFKTQEIKINGKTSINITMEEDAENLDEIVIVGYGKQKKESVLSAISQIKGEDLVKAGSPNVVNSLSGITPGLNIVQSSGKPGFDEGEIYIRGNANPLILVDGVEIVGGIANIDPRDIENVSVLKDGAATAVYGVRGANGVIIFTTKRGKIGPPKFSSSSQFAVKTLNNRPNMLNAYSGLSALNDAVLNDQAYTSGYTDPEDLINWQNGGSPYLYPDTNWQDVVLKDYATSLNQTLSMRGGTDLVKYYASVGYLQEGDITKTEKLFNFDPAFDFKRYSFRGNLDFTLSKTTRLKTSVSTRFENTNQPGSGSISFLNLYRASPLTTPIYPAEVMELFADPLYPGISEWRLGTGAGSDDYNMYADLNANYTGSQQNTKTVFSMDFELEQDLDFITKGLSFTGKYNYVSNYNTVRKYIYDGPRLDRYYLNTDGTWISTEGRNYERRTYTEGNESISYSQQISYYRAQLNYKRSFGKHNVTGMGLFSRNERIINTTFPYYNEDWVSRFTYNYASKYFFQVSGTYNGDETFAEGYRFKFFKSIEAGINLAKEDFVKKNIPALNNFKIRYSYGETGSKAGLGGSRWEYLSYYENITSTTLRSRYFFGEDINPLLTIIGETQIGNPELTWATVSKQNLGVDFGLFNNKLSGTVDFFNEKRDGLIGVPSSAIVPLFYGSTATLAFENYGASKRQGYEVALTYKGNIKGDFKYSVTGFYGFNENRILKSVADGAGTPEYSQLSGKPAGTTALLQDDGYFQNIDEVVNYPDFAGGPGLGDYRYVDYNADGSVVASDTDDFVKYDLPASPEHSFSLNFNFNYKSWNLSALLNGISGHKGLVNTNIAYALPGGNPTGRYSQLDYWTPTNTDAAYPAVHVLNTNNLTNSTARIVNLDYIKLRSLQLGYNFDVSNVKNISKLNVYVSGNNIFTISNIDYGDPEGNNPGSYPVLSRFNLGLNVSL